MTAVMSTTAAGPACAAFQGLMGRFAVGLRVGGAAAGGVGGFLGLAAPASAPAVAAAVGVLAGWSACFAVVLLRGGWRRWLVAVDLGLCAALCLGYGRLLPETGAGRATWLAVVASSAVVIGQVSPWPALGAAGTVLVPSAYATGSVLATGHVSTLSLLLAAQGTGAAGVMWILRRRAAAADMAIVEHEALQREAAVRAAARREEREHCRLLHDSVSATLTMVAAGGMRDTPALRAQATRDLAAVEQIRIPAVPARPGTDPVGLGGWLELVASTQPGLDVDVEVADLAVPGDVATGLTAAAAEALRNVARHAGTDRASLRAWSHRGTVRVEVADAGRGFDPALVPAQHRGLRESVLSRMAEVGGSAAVASAPGAGTRIVLRWPAAVSVPVQADPAAVTHGVADLVAARYRRGFEVALVLAAAVRLVGDGMVPILDHRSAYRSVTVELAAWTLMAAAGGVGAVHLLRRRTGAAVPWLLAAVVLAGSAVATLAVSAGQALTQANWAIGGAGWLGLLVLLRRPVAELAALITVNAGVTLAVLVHDGSADRGGLARLLMAVYIMAALQLGLALLVRALDGTAQRVADVAERHASVRRRGQLAEALHRSRLDRYETVCRSVGPLLVGLARGELDPADPDAQHRCAVEGSRLRRLLAETDDVPDPLLHELRACADVAHSRGVVVELQVIGQLPALSRSVRRALTDAPLHALAAAQHRARMTVVGRPGDVAVSILADVPVGRPQRPATAPPPAAAVAVQESVVARDGESQRWIEARWRADDALAPTP